MASTKLCGLLVVFYLIGPLAKGLPVTSSLGDPTVSLKFTYNEGLKNLNNLFDLVLHYEERVQSQNVTTENIQNSIKKALDSVAKMDRVTAFHSELYHLHLLSVTREITIKENKLRNDTAEHDRLTMECATWADKAESLRRDVVDLDAKVRIADELVKQIEDKSNWKRKMFFKRMMTHFAGGLPSSDHSISEKDFQRIKNERREHLANANESRLLLKNAEEHQQEIGARIKNIEKSINILQLSLLGSRSKQDQIRAMFLVMRDLGAQVRNINSFLTKFYDKLWLIDDQKEVVELLQPLGELISMLSRKPRQNGR